MAQFTDEAIIRVESGAGGNGIVSLDRRRNLPKGGPDGGNGGAGGDVILKVFTGLNSLFKFRYQTVFKAKNGRHGMGRKMQGESADDLVISVPPGTIISNQNTGEWICNMLKEGDTLLIARGGVGGQGNYSFRSSTNRTPRFQTNGQLGEQYDLNLQLQLLADIGLVGYPNAGKSTLLRNISNAKPKVASYPFTTLNPQLGIIDCNDHETLIMADIPGLVEGSSQGRGLGYQFLKHLHRTRLMLHLVECNVTAEDISTALNADAKMHSHENLEPYIVALVKNITQQIQTIRNELNLYSKELSAKPVWLVITKVDLLPYFSDLQDNKKIAAHDRFNQLLATALTDKGIQFEKTVMISSISQFGLTTLKDHLKLYQQHLQISLKEQMIADTENNLRD